MVTIEMPFWWACMTAIWLVLSSVESIIKIIGNIWWKRHKDRLIATTEAKLKRYG